MGGGGPLPVSTNFGMKVKINILVKSNVRIVYLFLYLRTTSRYDCFADFESQLCGQLDFLNWNLKGTILAFR